MELHLHLTVAFRALDRKWGTPVDLETPEELRTYVRTFPAVIERPTATFSSEEYLRTRSRPTPYSRYQERTRKENIKVNDSFSDKSCARIPSVSDLEELSSFSGSLNSDKSGLDRCIEEYLDDYGRKYKGGSTVTLDSGLGRSKGNNVFRQLKDTAKLYFDKKIKSIQC